MIVKLINCLKEKPGKSSIKQTCQSYKNTRSYSTPLTQKAYKGDWDWRGGIDENNRL